MKIIQKNANELIPYEKNAKKHDETQIKNVAESIKQYGFVQPVVVDKDNVIVIGHCRVLAAKQLNMETVPCVIADNLTEDEVRAYRLVDNKSRELSEWNFDRLEYEYTRLAESGVNLEEFGFNINTEEVVEKENATKEQGINDCEEFDLDDFDDEQFEYCCPNCGMRFSQ